MNIFDKVKAFRQKLKNAKQSVFYDTEKAADIEQRRIDCDAAGKDWKSELDGTGYFFRWDASGDRGKIYFYDIISSWWGIAAMDVIKALDAIGDKPVDMYINSPGGDVFESVAITAVIKRHSQEVVAYLDGMCASAATTVATAASKRVITNGARYMIHRAWCLCIGNALQLRDIVGLLDEIDEEASERYAASGNKSAEEFLEMMGKDTYLTAKKALEYGLVEEIADFDEPEEEEKEDPQDSTTSVQPEASVPESAKNSVANRKKFVEMLSATG